MNVLTLGSFILCTGLVALITWIVTRKDDHASSDGFFLAGRRLTFPFIAGSLLLTNLSTEQLVGLNGSAFTNGLAVMAWEVIAVIALVLMALFFLPRFLRSGVATVPQLLETRYDHQTHVITNIIFLFAYAAILLPIILYSGAMGLSRMLDVQGLFGLPNHTVALWLTVWFIGLLGSVYAQFGGLRTVAVSDLINGIGLLIGGLMIPYFGLVYYSEGGGMIDGLTKLTENHGEMLNSIAGRDSAVPFGTLFTGILLLNLFYWCTNQQIIQRTFGASSLQEGQKGVLLAGLFKLFGPLYLVIPGLLAFALFAKYGIKPDAAYGGLVKTVLPSPLTGFFAAVMIGAILSSFNSALNSTTTLFSLGLYKSVLKKDAPEEQVVRSGKIFGWIIAIISMIIAPLLAKTDSIFEYLQKMNGIYFIPIFAVVVVGLLAKRVPPIAAKVSLVVGCVVIALGYFVPLGQEDAKLVVKDALVQGADSTAAFQVYLTEAIDETITLEFKTVDGSAEAGVNYTRGEYLSVTFESGETAKTVSVPLINQENRDTASRQEKILTGHRDAFFLALAQDAPVDLAIDRPYKHYQGAVAACHIIDSESVTPETAERIKAEIEGVAAYAAVPPKPGPIFLTAYIHEYHFLGLVFVGLVALMLVIGAIRPSAEAWVQVDVKAVDMTPWKYAKWVGAVLVVLVILLYVFLADFSVLF